MVKTPDTVSNELMSAYATTERRGRCSWRRVAKLEKYHPIPWSSLEAMSRGIIIDKWRLHPAISLPITSPVQHCQDCGNLHDMFKTCTKKKDPRRRLTLSNDPVSAAKTLRNADVDWVLKVISLYLKGLEN